MSTAAGPCRRARADDGWTVPLHNHSAFAVIERE